jgi:hypothetical protein
MICRHVVSCDLAHTMTLVFNEKRGLSVPMLIMDEI